MNLIFPASAILAGVVKEYAEQNLDAIARKHNQIGRGCSADVYGFRLLDRDFALKKYHDMRRCEREITILGKISKFNLPVVPRVYARNLKKGIVVMDRMDETLKTYLHRNRDVPGRLVGDVLNGLAMLHGRRIVHGDLHTDNIMVRHGRVFFLDFGDAFFSDDFALDILRLRHRVLSEIEGWEGLVDRDGLKNPEAFGIVEKIYGDPGISRVFWLANLFNAPAMQRLVCSVLGFVTNLSSLISKYSCRIVF